MSVSMKASKANHVTTIPGLALANQSVISLSKSRTQHLISFRGTRELLKIPKGVDRNLHLRLVSLVQHDTALPAFLAGLPSKKYTLCSSMMTLMYANCLGSALLLRVIPVAIENTPSASLLFREGSQSAIFLSTFARLDGARFLDEAVMPTIRTIINKKIVLEVDPSRTSQKSHKLSKDRKLLYQLTKQILKRIVSQSLTSAMRKICKCLRRVAEEIFPKSTNQILGGFLFLRFICPAIVTPEKFSQLDVIEVSRVRRTLILVAKVLQAIANEVLDSGNEGYLVGLDKVVMECAPILQNYYEREIQACSSPFASGNKGSGKSKKRLEKRESVIEASLDMLDTPRSADPRSLAKKHAATVELATYFSSNLFRIRRVALQRCVDYEGLSVLSSLATELYSWSGGNLCNPMSAKSFTIGSLFSTEVSRWTPEMVTWWAIQEELPFGFMSVLRERKVSGRRLLSLNPKVSSAYGLESEAEVEKVRQSMCELNIRSSPCGDGDCSFSGSFGSLLTLGASRSAPDSLDQYLPSSSSQDRETAAKSLSATFGAETPTIDEHSERMFDATESKASDSSRKGQDSLCSKKEIEMVVSSTEKLNTPRLEKSRSEGDMFIEIDDVLCSDMIAPVKVKSLESADILNNKKGSKIVSSNVNSSHKGSMIQMRKKKSKLKLRKGSSSRNLKARPLSSCDDPSLTERIVPGSFTAALGRIRAHDRDFRSKSEAAASSDDSAESDLGAMVFKDGTLEKGESSNSVDSTSKEPKKKKITKLVDLTTRAGVGTSIAATWSSAQVTEWCCCQGFSRVHDILTDRHRLQGKRLLKYHDLDLLLKKHPQLEKLPETKKFVGAVGRLCEIVRHPDDPMQKSPLFSSWDSAKLINQVEASSYENQVQKLREMVIILHVCLQNQS